MSVSPNAPDSPVANGYACVGVRRREDHEHWYYPLKIGFFVTKGCQKCERKLRRIKGLEGEIGNGLFDFYGVHGFILVAG